MRRSAENVIEFYDSILSSSGVTARQYSLLNAVYNHKGCNVRILSEATLLDRSTLARSLKPLMQNGYIKDCRLPGSRDKVLELTRKGVAVRNKAMLLWETAQEQFESKLGNAQLTEFEKTLELLQDL